MRNERHVKNYALESTSKIKGLLFHFRLGRRAAEAQKAQPHRPECPAPPTAEPASCFTKGCLTVNLEPPSCGNSLQDFFHANWLVLHDSTAHTKLFSVFATEE